MELESKSLNIPLRKRSWFSWQMTLGSMLAGWLWHRPTDLPQALVSLVLGGAGVWFCLASPLVLKIGSHKVPLVRGAIVILAVSGLVLWMSKVVPYVHGLVA